jgi:hypothetical protein
MTRSIPIAMLFLISALNLVVLAVNLSRPSRAAVGGMSYRSLARDRDFTRAVQSIVEACAVNIDIGKVKC